MINTVMILCESIVKVLATTLNSQLVELKLILTPDEIEREVTLYIHDEFVLHYN
jgi:hypothetical protein